MSYWHSRVDEYTFTSKPTEDMLSTKALRYIKNHPGCTTEQLYEDGLGKKRLKGSSYKYASHSMIYYMKKFGLVEAAKEDGPQYHYYITADGEKRLSQVIKKNVNANVNVNGPINKIFVKAENSSAKDDIFLPKNNVIILNDIDCEDTVNKNEDSLDDVRTQILNELSIISTLVRNGTLDSLLKVFKNLNLR